MEDMEKLRLEALRLGANAFTDYNFIRLETAEPDRAVYRLEIRPESRNPYGMVHGGALYGGLQLFMRRPEAVGGAGRGNVK